MTGPVPGGYLDSVAAMYEVMNDAPLESGALEDEKWTRSEWPAWTSGSLREEIASTPSWRPVLRLGSRPA
jgi:hypothetical protein